MTETLQLEAKSVRRAAATSGCCHDHLRHGQTGNVFYPWWSVSALRCPLCLALKVDEGVDVAQEFVRLLPFRIDRRILGDHEAGWWVRTFRVAAWYMRQQGGAADVWFARDSLSRALRRGLEEEEGGS